MGKPCGCGLMLGDDTFNLAVASLYMCAGLIQSGSSISVHVC